MCFTGLYMESWGRDAVAAQQDTEALPPPCAIDQALLKPPDQVSREQPWAEKPRLFLTFKPSQLLAYFPHLSPSVSPVK